MIEDTLFPTNIVTRRKKREPEKKLSTPPPSKKQQPAKEPMESKKKPPEEKKPKEKSDLEKLTGRTAKEIAHLNEEINVNEDNEELLDDVADDDNEEGEECNEEETYNDKFICNCEGLESFRVKSIELPKMIFIRHKSGQSIKEKSSFMIYFYSALTATHADGAAPYPYKAIMEICKKDNIALSIDWLDTNDKKSCTWKFNGARVQGLDLGSAAYERPDIAEAAIEISYDTINVDGIEF